MSFSAQIRLWNLSCFLLLLTTACTSKYYYPQDFSTPSVLFSKHFVASDGAHLPLRVWPSHDKPKALLLALHGFNDYSRFFEKAGLFFSQHGISCFAYDQRGFGSAPKRGHWAGEQRYYDDMITLVRLLKAQHPGVPLYLLGESMGGAVILAAHANNNLPEVEGIILSAPAIWARSTMPWYQRSLLWFLSHTVPRLHLTGKQVKVWPSDNMEMLKELGRDPLVIKETRVESINGLANLMDQAFYASKTLSTRSLLLYGERDQVIPKKPTLEFIDSLLNHNSQQKVIAFYEHGYHMLLRDLHADIPLQDILHWIKNRSPSLPSKADFRARQAITKYKNSETSSTS